MVKYYFGTQDSVLGPKPFVCSCKAGKIKKNKKKRFLEKKEN